MATQHHKQHVGLQNHSVGPLYPWSVVRIGDRCEQPRQLVSGELGPEFPLGQEFGKSAYVWATDWIRERVSKAEVFDNYGEESAGKYVDAQRELGELAYSPSESLTEYTFLIPDSGNVAKFHALETELLEKFGGYTSQLASGVWLSSSGEAVSDDSIRYSVAIKPNQLASLRELVERACQQWQQACVYFAKSATQVELIS